MRRRSKFKVDEHAIITGDSGAQEHEFEIGEEVRLVRFDTSDGTWMCEYLDKRDYWWVDEEDMVPAPKPPTERELKAALKSIERSARNVRGRRS